ncbi:hypothetical protein D3C87_2082530 [compost metagenome]
MAQAARKAVPPKGVTAPSQWTPVSDSVYKLPENSTMPTNITKPAADSKGEPKRAPNSAMTNRPSAWIR